MLRGEQALGDVLQSAFCCFLSFAPRQSYSSFFGGKLFRCFRRQIALLFSNAASYRIKRSALYAGTCAEMAVSYVWHGSEHSECFGWQWRDICVLDVWTLRKWKQLEVPVPQPALQADSATVLALCVSVSFEFVFVVFLSLSFPQSDLV